MTKTISKRQLRRDAGKKPQTLINFNIKLFEDSKGQLHRIYLKPTKGFKKINRVREALGEQSKVDRYKRFLYTLQRCQQRNQQGVL